jgi:hypothetical protein
MPVLLRAGFLAFSLTFTAVGLLMLVAPARFPSLYSGFLRQSVMQRETTESGRVLTIRTQGLVCLSCGLLFGLFLWALR